jgi:hypothetical protein
VSRQSAIATKPHVAGILMMMVFLAGCGSALMAPDAFLVRLAKQLFQ